MSAGATASRVRQTEDPLAIVSRDVAIQVLDCSASGCLLETRGPLEVGTVGTLRVIWRGEERVEDVRIARCQRIAGASRYHIGVQFVGAGVPGDRSLRRAVHRATLEQSPQYGRAM